MKKFEKYLRMTAILAAFLLVGGELLFRTVFAAAAQIYVSPSTSGVQNGSSVTVAVRVNAGGASADSANVTLTYDSSKLTFVSISTGGSPITSAANYTNTGNTITGGAYTTTPATGDFLLFNATFRAKVGSGSAALGFSTAGAYGTEVDSGGSSIGAALVGGTVNFSQPVCPSGQTGAWPNCVPITPPSSTGGTSDGSPSGGTSSTSSTTPASGGSSKTTTTTSTTTTQPASAPANPSVTPVVASQAVQFTTAKFSTTSQVPTQVYLEYGTSKDSLTFKTPLSSLGTSHDISLDANALVPGQTYYYAIVAQDQQGSTSQSEVASFTAKGMTLNVNVFDANHKPLANKVVTLHSTAYQATTNAKGVTTFSNVAPGDHHLTYTDGGKTYSQNLTVDNTIKTASDGTQTALPQNLSVVYSAYTLRSGSPLLWVILVIVVLAAIGAALYFFRAKLPFHTPKSGTGPAAQPVSTGEGGQPTLSAEQMSELAANDALARIKVPDKPKPGITILPTDNDAVVITSGAVPVAAADETLPLPPREEVAAETPVQGENSTETEQTETGEKAKPEQTPTIPEPTTEPAPEPAPAPETAPTPAAPEQSEHETTPVAVAEERPPEPEQAPAPAEDQAEKEL